MFLSSVRRGVTVAEKDMDRELSGKSEITRGSTSYRDFYATAVYKQMLVKRVEDLKGNYCFKVENASRLIFKRKRWLGKCRSGRLWFGALKEGNDGRWDNGGLYILRHALARYGSLTFFCAVRDNCNLVVTL